VAVIRDQLPAQPEVNFNNALIEKYSVEYRCMGAHSDQAMDMADDSYICLFSCYSDGVEPDLRQLVVTDKLTKEEHVFVLHPSSAVIFSVSDNARFLHKIVTVHAISPAATTSTWMGVTLRQSKTMLQFVQGIPRFRHRALTLLTTHEEASLFYRQRKCENATVGPYAYAEDVLYCTLSPSDMLKPT
jgi:hypothetical protein